MPPGAQGQAGEGIDGHGVGADVAYVAKEHPAIGFLESLAHARAEAG